MPMTVFSLKSLRLVVVAPISYLPPAPWSGLVGIAVVGIPRLDRSGMLLAGCHFSGQGLDFTLVPISSPSSDFPMSFIPEAFLMRGCSRGLKSEFTFS